MWMVMRMMNFVHFHLGRPFLFQLMGQYHLHFWLDPFHRYYAHSLLNDQNGLEERGFGSFGFG
uniref:Uncharacterized protein n=1 Tax=Meloidogyne incognita TaxID=6306 RepID=A0A914N5T4_MELIC